MKSLQDIIKKRRTFQALSLVMIIFDLVTFCVMEVLDIIYTLPNEDFAFLRTIFILKIVVMLVFITFLLFMLILQFINTLIISSIAYLVIGVVLFFYLLIDQVKDFQGSINSRPISFFEDNINVWIIVLNILTGLFRIIGGIMIIIFIHTLQKEKRRYNSEKEEAIIRLNESLRGEGEIINDIIHRSFNKSGSISPSHLEETKDNIEDAYKIEKSRQRKTSLFSDSADSYRKFETPRTLSKL